MDKAFLVFKRKSETEKMISSAIKILYIESDHFCRSIGSNSINLQEFCLLPFPLLPTNKNYGVLAHQTFRGIIY